MDKLDKIEQKIDKISDKISSIDSTLAAQHESLKDHMRRTELLENQIKPIQKSVNVLNAIAKVLGWIIAGGIVTTLVSFFKK